MAENRIYVICSDLCIIFAILRDMVALSDCHIPDLSVAASLVLTSVGDSCITSSIVNVFSDSITLHTVTNQFLYLVLVQLKY